MRMGGTWDLFRYPGVRSDSDMYTLGYPFKPWTRGQGHCRRPGHPAATWKETADEHGLHAAHPPPATALQAADWSAADACWTLRVAAWRQRRCR